MVALTRRSFVAGTAAIPFAVWFERYARAAGPYVRYDARSANGQAMLKSYAAAVGKMQTTATIPEGSPQSWTFQWYSHFVKGSTTKAAELARIYPSANPWKALATAMWDNCQAHSGQPENYFLPWHRMFVYFFEQIIRNVGGNAYFTLPYWNYTVSGPTYAVIPPEFTKKGDPTFGPLYVDKRNTGVNAGNPIAPPGYLNLDSLKECIYEQNGAVQGFCANLDGTLHGRVHVRTGNTLNMGAVPWAAGDPVFWAHHCNIDRIWASWNAGGRKNPNDSTFLNKTFVFADGAGNKVVAKIKDFLDITTLGYSYDQLEPVPPCPTNKRSFLAAALATVRTHAVLKKSVTLGAAPVHATLSLAPAAGASAGAAHEAFAQRLSKVAPDRSLYLVLKGLRANVQPGVLYDVYLQLPSGTTPDKAADHRVGTISFFDTGHGDHTVAGAGTAAKFVSFDVTDLVTKLAADKLLATGKLDVTFAPLGHPEAAAKPSIGEISIVEQ
ncbi:MAG TPA: tyrosinase family protein [Thermoanaerobaculia bacterium]|nr:tyrosinase family protein [Thermoanaerobaculia bacterium]